MKDETKSWFHAAQRDIQDAEILLKGKSYQGAIWHCHQAIEKALKGIHIEKKSKFRKTHDLVDLATESKFKFPETIISFLSELNPYYNPARYPDAAFEIKILFSRSVALGIVKRSKEVIKWLENLMR